MLLQGRPFPFPFLPFPHTPRPSLRLPPYRSLGACLICRCRCSLSSYVLPRNSSHNPSPLDFTSQAPSSSSLSLSHPVNHCSFARRRPLLSPAGEVKHCATINPTLPAPLCQFRPSHSPIPGHLRTRDSISCQLLTPGTAPTVPHPATSSTIHCQLSQTRKPPRSPCPEPPEAHASPGPTPCNHGGTFTPTPPSHSPQPAPSSTLHDTSQGPPPPKAKNVPGLPPSLHPSIPRTHAL